MVSRWWDPGIGERNRIGMGSGMGYLQGMDRGVFILRYFSNLRGIDGVGGKGIDGIPSQIGSRRTRILISSPLMTKSQRNQGSITGPGS
ncbi:hypothetical protein HA466_0320420 [Hirschfeldia incana]|nr:hypothetical protein HA466_0320420 [Hirschfeldia incana]